MKIAFFWFRRDLRLEDNAGFSAALQSKYPVLPLFIFDQTILSQLEDQDDPRVTFIYEAIQKMRLELEAVGGTLLAYYGKPVDIWKKLVNDYDIAEVYTNHDYETYAIQRDDEIQTILKIHNIPLRTYKDQVIFEKREVLNGKNEPYTVFTPYSKKWKSQLTDKDLAAYNCNQYFTNLYTVKVEALPSLTDMGFVLSPLYIPTSEVEEHTVVSYAKNRDYPALDATTHLGIHLRFGTVSIRQLVSKARQWNEVWLNELIWREFFMMILANFPQVEKHAFKPAYDRIQWRNNPEEFQKWCDGQTGYPIVDAGMRQLNETGFMHNRVRMITASFLVKHLLIDWRWGEAYFARKLLDYELASNNGNWQWAAGSGCDAAPYFRVFNPALQTQKFDKSQAYIKKWVPEVGTENYPAPIVEHESARERVLKAYKKALQS
ncbi:deoxyribodipyrimidine photo-lyase [Cytophagaceae bacterium DM2B3-1]|uniref:Deoxyribodipyrimidine photo-lyase n=1 Tax=Xanthocytophaga flava TaxID=3048013 RepID=A0ABT7CJR5_9BACT|nr:deoxyribodipyrimidine photo-lyase [Xanthocytophaga flavus]MDJ1469511.1 deoxyribodipyrimidine photo-lyase [Xanthocytophaga flavus]MDJ1493976.1 deoxyribodipyrimidine photo-lyase [Xanthocytophaga flavus]